MITYLVGIGLTVGPLWGANMTSDVTAPRSVGSVQSPGLLVQVAAGK